MKPFRILSLIVLTLFIMFVSPVFAQEQTEFAEPEISYASAKVLNISEAEHNLDLEDAFSTGQKTQLVKVQILNGEHKGKQIEIENHLTQNPIYDITINEGQRVLLNIEETPEGNIFYITDVERFPVLMIVLGFFLALLLLVGGKKGVNAIISLVITALLVFFVLIPAILNNYPPILSAVAVSLISTLLTMTVVGGFNKKSLAGSLGTILSVSLAGLMALLIIKFGNLTGFHNQESAMLWMSRPDLSFSGVLAAAVIIGALGAVMDVGMSIASSIAELKSVNSELQPKDLIKSGMNVGRDIMGTMANTLILAYIGGAFSLVLLAANAPLVKLINLNSVATEITAAITGSIGIVLCVPITAVISAYLLGQTSKQDSEEIEYEEQEAAS